MSSFIKEAVAGASGRLQSLQTTSYSRLPQFPSTAGLQNKTSNFHTRNPKAIIIFLILVFILFWRNIISDVCSHFIQRAPAAPVDDNPIRNSTLGFEKVFVLSLPEREDRRVPLLAAANGTNITLTVLDAVRDRQIPQSDWPKWWGTNGWVPKEGELGCLMSHVRTWRKIVHENITSALVMESDVDWDMRIKDSMVGLGEGVKAIADWPFDPPKPKDSKHPRDFEIQMQTFSPYGDKWDLVWMGHCGSSADGNGRIYAWNDTSAPDEEHAWSFAERPGEGHRPPGTRIVFQMRKTVCTTAYMISNQGARKFEKIFREANSPIDLKIWSDCEHNPDLSCLGVWPQIISMAESKTNIKHTEGGQAFGHEVVEDKVVAGNGIQISARVNAKEGLAHLGPDHWKAEWSNGVKAKEILQEHDDNKDQQKQDQQNNDQQAQEAQSQS